MYKEKPVMCLSWAFLFLFYWRNICGMERAKKKYNRDRIFKVRLNEYENDMLMFLANEDNLSRAEVLRKAIRVMYNFKKFGNFNP